MRSDILRVLMKTKGRATEALQGPHPMGLRYAFTDGLEIMERLLPESQLVADQLRIEWHQDGSGERSLLDFGAGRGLLAQEVVQRSKGDPRAVTNYVALDTDARLASHAALRAAELSGLRSETIRADLFGSNQRVFDLILASHVLYYLPETARLPLLELLSTRLSDRGKISVILRAENCFTFKAGTVLRTANPRSGRSEHRITIRECAQLLRAMGLAVSIRSVSMTADISLDEVEKWANGAKYPDGVGGSPLLRMLLHSKRGEARTEAEIESLNSLLQRFRKGSSYVVPLRTEILTGSKLD